MLARVPVLLQFLHARMSSIPRSRMTIGQSRQDVNGVNSSASESLCWLPVSPLCFIGGWRSNL